MQAVGAGRLRPFPLPSPGASGRPRAAENFEHVLNRRDAFCERFGTGRVAGQFIVLPIQLEVGPAPEFCRLFSD